MSLNFSALFIFILYFLSFKYIYSLSLSEKYPFTYLMSNGNLFVITANGIRVFDSTLQNRIKYHDFSSSIIVSIIEDASKTTIAQFSNSYILALYNNILFICSSEGEYIFEKDLNSKLNSNYYSLIPYKIISSDVYYYIITFYNNGKLSILYYKLTISTRKNEIIKEFVYEPYSSENALSSIMYQGLSCQIMSKDNEDVLTCFYEINFPFELSVRSFKIDESTSSIISEINMAKKFSSNQRATVIKSVISSNKEKALICYTVDSAGGSCLKYDIKNNEFSPEVKYFESCKGTIPSMNLYYFEETDEYMFICNDINNSKGYNVVTFNSDLEASITSGTTLPEPNYSFGKFCMSNTVNIIYLPYANDYIMINDFSNGNDIYSTGNINLSELSEENNYPSENMEIIVKENPHTADDTTNNVDEDTTNNVEDDTTNNVNDDTTYNVEDDTTNNANDDTTNNVEDDTTNNVNDDTTNNVNDDTTYNAEDDTTNNVEDDTTNNINDDTTNNINDDTTNNAEDSESLTQNSEINNVDDHHEVEETNKNTNNEEISSSHISIKDNIFISSSNKSKEEIVHDLEELISDKDPDETYVINGEDFTIIIRPVDEQVEDSTVNIDFSECKKLLKEKYPTKEFRILQINMENENEKCLSDQVEYKVYDENGDEMDLSICEEVEIKIEYKITNTSLLNLEQISNLKAQGIDVFDLDSDFFNDICFAFSDDNSDMILSDRVSDIYQNYSICGDGCEYESFNIETLSANCKCKVKQEVSTKREIGNFKNYLQTAFFESNFGIVKCYNLFFSLIGKLKNVGFWIFGGLIIFHTPLYILYFINGITPVAKYIQNEMDNKGYLSKNKIKEYKYSEMAQTKETEQNLKENNNNISSKLKNKKSKKLKRKNKIKNPPKKDGNNKKMNKIRIKTDNSPEKNKFQFIDIEDNDIVIADEDNNKKNKKSKKIKKEKIPIDSQKKEIIRARTEKKVTQISKVTKLTSDEENSNKNLEKIKSPSRNNTKDSDLEYNTLTSSSNDVSISKKFSRDKEINKKSRFIKDNNDEEEINIEKKISKKLINKQKQINKQVKKYNNKKKNNLIGGLESNDNLKLNLEKKLKKNKNKKIIKFSSNLPKGNEDKYEIKKSNREYPLILINADNSGDHNPLKSNYILNNYNFKEAIKYDNRSFCRIFFIYLISKENILNIIFFNPPLELKPIRICVFIFTFACDFALNAIFYLSSNISDRYHYTGKNKLLFSIVNNLTISFASTIICFVLLYFFQSLTQSSNKIEKLFREQEKLLKGNKKYKVKEGTKIKIDYEIKNIIKCLKIKIIFFIILEPLFMLFFLYYATIFCQVYKNTQISWLLDTISSYAISILITLFVSFFCTILYKISVNYKNNILYKISTFVYSFA